MTRVEGRSYLGELIVLRDMIDDEPRPNEHDAFSNWGEDFMRPAFEIYRFMVCAGDAEEAVGTMSWHAAWYGPTRRSRAWNIGIGLATVARGRGIGSVAQRMLAEHLLATTDAERIEASTDVLNLPEQRALERVGFVREGILRAAQQRADGQHDLVSYSLTRADVEGSN